MAKIVVFESDTQKILFWPFSVILWIGIPLIPVFGIG